MNTFLTICNERMLYFELTLKNQSNLSLQRKKLKLSGNDSLIQDPTANQW